MEILLHQFQRKCPRQCNVVKYGIVVGATSMGNPKVYKALGKKHNMTLAETHTFIEYEFFFILLIVSIIARTVADLEG